MKVLKIIGKILAFPVMLIVTVFQWAFVFLVSFSSVILYLLAGLFLLVAVLSLIFATMCCLSTPRPRTWPAGW